MHSKTYDIFKRSKPGKRRYTLQKLRTHHHIMYVSTLTHLFPSYPSFWGMSHGGPMASWRFHNKGSGATSIPNQEQLSYSQLLMGYLMVI